MAAVTHKAEKKSQPKHDIAREAVNEKDRPEQLVQNTPQVTTPRVTADKGKDANKHSKDSAQKGKTGDNKNKAGKVGAKQSKGSKDHAKQGKDGSKESKEKDSEKHHGKEGQKTALKSKL